VNPTLSLEPPRSFIGIIARPSPLRQPLFAIKQAQLQNLENSMFIKVTARNNFKLRTRVLVNEFSWDATDARKIRCFGPNTTGPNLLVDVTKVSQRFQFPASPYLTHRTTPQMARSDGVPVLTFFIASPVQTQTPIISNELGMFSPNIIVTSPSTRTSESNSKVETLTTAPVCAFFLQSNDIHRSHPVLVRPRLRQRWDDPHPASGRLVCVRRCCSSPSLRLSSWGRVSGLFAALAHATGHTIRQRQHP
jgi:hypothetical protein